MNEYSPEEKLRNKMLHDAGFAVVESSCSFDGPSPEIAWRIVVRGDAVPDIRVSHESDVDDYLSEVDRGWEATAKELGIFGSDGRFLISVAGERIGSMPWAHVRRGQAISPARHLVTCPGQPEFVAMSLDGRAVCGATTEEYDIWIIGAELPRPAE